MDEIDKVMLHDLRSVGCEIGEKVGTCKDIRAELPACMLRCLKVADKEQRYPDKLSKGIAKKVNQITRLISRVKELGFLHEFSYHQVLYPSEQDARVLLTWLRDFVLKDGEYSSRTSEVHREMIERMDSLKERVWVPCFEVEDAGFPCVEELSTHRLHIPFAEVDGSEVVWEYWRGLKEQVSENGGLAPSIFEHNARLLCDQQDAMNLRGGEERMWMTGGEEYRKRLTSALKRCASRKNERTERRTNTRLSRRLAYGGKSYGLLKVIHSGSEREREESLTSLSDKAAPEIASSISREEKCEETEVSTFLKSLGREGSEGVCVELDHVIDALSDSTGCPSDILEGRIHKKKAQLRRTAETWEKSRLCFLERYREARTLALQEGNARSEKENRIDQLRQSIRLLTQKLTELDREKSNLSRMHENSSKSSREVYIEYIVDLLKSIERQNLELLKNSEHLLEAKREVNVLMETIQRSYFSAEEKILTVVKKNPQAKHIYDELLTIDHLFDRLIELSEKNGYLKREELELKEEHSKLRSRLGQIDLEAMKRDLDLTKKENIEPE